MRHVLTKMSSSGWEKVYDYEEDAQDQLRLWICKTCMYELHRKINNWEVDIYDLLGTPCGAEFNYERE